MSAETAKAFESLVRNLINALPEENKGALQCQVSLTNGANLAGGLLLTENPGIFLLKAPLRKGDPRTGPVYVVDLYASFESIMSILIDDDKGAKKEESRIITPDIPPRMRGV